MEEDPLIINPKLNANVAAGALETQKIGTMSDGMSYQEAYRRAAKWWNRVGRLRMKKVANNAEIGRRYSHSKAGPSIVVAGSIEPELKESGIMLGRVWDRLTMAERARVTVAWHQETIVMPAHDANILPDV